jgi:catechol 2,3-dioxygenase-like lactoylglutathione lyase family enzyme
VGIVVDDLAAATAFFVEPRGGAHGGPGGHRDGGDPGRDGRLELTKFHAPPGRGGAQHAPANTQGIRHVAFAVDDIEGVVAGLRARGGELVGEVESYEDSYRLCYVRGPEGIIVELAEQTG